MPSQPDLPAAFRRRIAAAFEGGAAWLESLPAILSECEGRWGLKLGPPFPDLSYNYVAPATLSGGGAAVLKAGVPNAELTSEIEALRAYGGEGAVRLLDADGALGVLLMERLQPGTMLAELRDDEQATAIAAGVMRRLWRPLAAGHPFIPLRRWLGCFQRLRLRYEGGSGPLPAGLLARAEGLAAELLAEEGEPVLLHGDLHHYNILQAGPGRWLAIDPKGVAGEAGFDVAALLHNPLDLPAWPDLDRILARRVRILSEQTGIERERVVAWGLVGAMLSACWDVEEGAAPGRMAAVARRLAALG